MNDVPSGLYRRLATSGGTFPRLVRRVRHAPLTLSVPAPRLLTMPALWLAGMPHGTRSRCGCSSASCSSKHIASSTAAVVHDRHLHWVAGFGDIVVGDDVLPMDGSRSPSPHAADRPCSKLAIEPVSVTAASLRSANTCRRPGLSAVWRHPDHGFERSSADPRQRWSGRPQQRGGPTCDDLRRRA